MKTNSIRFPSKPFACIFWACLMMLSACSRGPAASSFSEGDAFPTSRPNENAPIAVSARLLERLVPSSTSSYGPSQFGSAIALYGDTLAVGASERHGMAGYGKGIVYVYQREGEAWVEIAELAASDKEDGFQSDLYFGSALALEADTLFVGAPGARDRDTGESVGVVYIFRRGEAGWEETGILHASDPTAGASFGERIALNGDVLLVSGGQAVYVFEQTVGRWVEQARLTEENVGERDRFGYTLAVDRDTLAVAAMAYDPDLERYTSSTVHLFQRTLIGWTLVSTLTPGDGEEPVFVYSLALEGRTLVIGSADDAAGFWSGAVYIYENRLGDWKPQAKLVAADASFSSFTGFGSSVALLGDLLAVGAAGDSSQGAWAGAAYLFRKQGNTWVEQQKIWPDEADYLGAFFGSDVKLSENTLLVAAPSEYGNAMYVYKIGTDEK